MSIYSAMNVQCCICRKWGAPMWQVFPDGRREMVATCCDFVSSGQAPDVAQWLRTRSVKVAWLINARRNVPGLTVDRRTL